MRGHPLRYEGGRDEVAGGCACRGFTRLRRASCFPFGESSQSHRAAQAGLRDVVSFQLPVGLRRPAARRGDLRRRWEPCCVGGRPWPATPWCAASCVIARRVARTMRASSPWGQGWPVGEPRRPQTHPAHREVRRAGSRGGLLFGVFLLAIREQGTRAPGRGAETDGDVVCAARIASAPKACETAGGEVSVAAHRASSTCTAAIACAGRFNCRSKPSPFALIASASGWSCEARSSSATCRASR